jgi:peptidoglycan/xylan/chitin deacetylase (PgdA/CDA1 family)
MFDLKKLEDNNAIFWIFKFPEYRKIAAECGWAIAIHGSAVHDLDLMAMPWVESHTSADELAQRLTDTEQPNFRRPYEKSKPGDKPNGRIVYTIFVGGTYIDLNVIEHPGKNAIVESVIDWLHAHTAMSEFEYELMRKELEG